MLKAVLETLEGVDENIAGLYSEVDGKYVLQVEGAGGYALEDVSGIKSALAKERTRADKAEKAVKAFEGLDPTKAREALEKYEELSQLDPAKEADKIIEERVKAVREKMTEQHRRELEERETRIKALEGEADQNIRMKIKSEAFDKHGVIPERRRALDAFVDRYIRTDVVDGRRTAVVVDDEGNPRIAGDGTNMNVEAFVADLSKDQAFSPFFKGVDGSGGGTPPGRNGGGPAIPQVSKMSRAEKAKALSEGSLSPADLAKAG